MALKTDRFLGETDIGFFMNEVATRGGIVCFKTVGSGAAMDQSAALVTYAATSSGNKPLGILMNDMVNKDLTHTHLNQHKDEVQQGGKVTILKRGYVVTNMLLAGITVAAGDIAYLSNSGPITNVKVSSLTVSPAVGQFMSSVDEDGYAKVEVNLPQH